MLNDLNSDQSDQSNKEESSNETIEQSNNITIISTDISLDTNSDIPIDPIEQVQIGDDKDYCTFCLASNKKSEPINKCIQCKEFFCQEHQSHANLFYCSICLHDIKVDDTTITKTKERFSINLDKVVKKHYHCRQIKFDGETWRRSIALIEKLTDSELHDAVEIHRASVNMMEQEILRRNIKKAQDSVLRDRGTRSSVPKIRVPIVKQSTNKNTKQVLSTLDPTSLAKLLKKSGITPAILQKQLADILAKKGVS